MFQLNKSRYWHLVRLHTCSLLVYVYRGDAEKKQQSSESKVAAEPSANLCVMGPCRAHKTGRIFPPDEQQWSPLHMRTHMRTYIHTHYTAARQAHSDTSDYWTSAANMHSQNGQTNSPPSEVTFSQPAEWCGHHGATRGYVSVSTRCVLTVRRPLG